jgi:predicted ATPase
MHALGREAYSYIWCGDYTAAHAQLDELIALADERGKALGTVSRGEIFALTGNAPDAVQAITSGMTSLQATGATLFVPRHLWHLAIAYAHLGQPDDARRCIEDAIDKIESSKEKWCEAEVNRIAGEIALKSPARDTEKAEKYFDRALAVARQQQTRSWELRTAMSLARLVA